MSRFFRAGSESESESESSGEESQQPQRPTGARVFQLSDDEEDSKRVVRSEKDKRYEEINTVIKQLKNHKKIKDMSNVLTDFEALGKAYDKARKVVDKEGIPRFYIRCLVELEDFVNECWEDRDWRKQISKSNSKGLTTLRQKLKKYLRDFTDEVTKYRDNPDAGEDEEGVTRDSVAKDADLDDDDADSEADDDDLDMIPKIKPKKEIAKLSDDEEDDDSDDWGSSTTDSDSESEDDQLDGLKLTAEYFLKKTTEDERLKREERKREKKKEKEMKRKLKEGEDEDGEWEEVKGGVPLMTEKPKMFSKDQEINHEAVLKKQTEILSARGKKSTDRSEQIELFKELLAVSEAANLGPAIAIKIMFNIVSAIFDYNPNIATCMKADVWHSCLQNLTDLLTLLQEHEDIVIGEHIQEDSQSFETAPYRIRGCVLTMVERMDEEFTKMLQACDAHSTEYVDRLKDEQTVVDITIQLEKYMEGRATADEMCRVYLRRIEQTYYKFDHSAVEGKHDSSSTEESSEKMMDRLCKYIYAKDSTDRLRTRSMLCHIYHHALHDRWFQARDLMLMSHLQDTIHHSDVPTQLLYNRTLVQLGLCGFRRGMIRDAHNALVDIQSSNRAKELLAQGLLPQRQHERTAEQEKIEKRRLLPYHKHINLELLECVYLVSAMLLEIPYMAAHELDVRRRMISKNFHHVMKMSERQNLTGPPESMREHVVAASKAMKTGDWKACKNFIINEKMNAKVWDLFYDKDAVRELITNKIQEESLRTYLFTYSSVYDSLSMDTLSDMFELKKPVVHSIISKMIINEELMASLDEPTQTVVMHRTEPSRLQSLALQLSEKVATLVENNERIMEIKQGNFYFQKSNQPGGYQQNNPNWNRQDRQDRQGGWGNRQDRDRQNQGGWKGQDRQGGWGNRRDRDQQNQGGWKGQDRQGGWGNRRDRDQQNQGGYQGGWNRRNRQQRAY